MGVFLFGAGLVFFGEGEERIMIGFMIWIIGWLFTCGTIIDPSDKSQRWWPIVAMAFWPLMLGCLVKKLYEKKKA